MFPKITLQPHPAAELSFHPGNDLGGDATFGADITGTADKNLIFFHSSAER
jgi:hypothetical protein